MAYTLGFDFGTLSARCLLVDMADGRECALKEYVYPHAVMESALPNGRSLARDWALQHPKDYLYALKLAEDVLKEANVKAHEICGIGIVFTACTMLPVNRYNEPLCLQKEFENEPNAWVKLWKHHSAQAYADRLNEIAWKRGEPFIKIYGGKLSSEWLFPKIFETLDLAPKVYESTFAFVEACDWLIGQMCGRLVRNNAAASAKGCWNKRYGYPSGEYLFAVDPRLAAMPAEKLEPVSVAMVGTSAGRLTESAAAWMGLVPGVAVAVGHMDGHGSTVGAGIIQPGRTLFTMGTSSCNLIMTNKRIEVPGITGALDDIIVPGYVGSEAGQSGFGDHYAWFINKAVPHDYSAKAQEMGIGIYQYLADLCKDKLPGETGLLALDWWNGNRSILNNANLSGLMLGLKLTTKPEDIYCALVEATAFGNRVVLENYEAHGVAIKSIVAVGGIANKDAFLMQVFADITGMELTLPASKTVPALSAAVWGAIAAGTDAGGCDDLPQAVRTMVKPDRKTYRPNAKAHRDYEMLFQEYKRLYDYFGSGQNDVMLRLTSYSKAQEKRRFEGNEHGNEKSFF